MKSSVSSWVRISAKRVLAALAIAVSLSLATPTAFADISFIATDLTNGGTTNNGVAPGNGDSLNFGPTEVGKFSVQIQSFRTDPNPSTLSTTTIDIDNKGTVTSTIDIKVSSINFTTGSAGTPTLVFTSSVQGTTSNGKVGQTATGQTWIDTSNTLFGTPAAGTSGSLTGMTTSAHPGTYTFPNSGDFGTITALWLGNFSLTQDIKLALAPGKSGQITISSAVNAIPEPSTMALGGLGALGLIGYGLRRRKALGA